MKSTRSNRAFFHDLTGKKLDTRLEQMRLLAHLDPESKALFKKVERGVRHEKK